MAFSYYSPISINSGQVPSTQTDFPVLVSITDARFKTVGNGGHVQNSSGFDIRPYTDSTLTTAIAGYELEFYDGTNGIVVMWVKISSLSSSTTPIYLAYGNPSLTTDGSSTTTWSNSFSDVMHLKNGTTLSTADSVGALGGASSNATATTGKIDGGAGFLSASSQTIGYTSGVPSLTSITLSAWLNATSFPNALNTIIGKSDGASRTWEIFINSSAKTAFALTCVSGTVTYNGSTATLSTGTWYYLAATYSSAAGLVVYLNASVDKTLGASGNVIANGSSPNVKIGSDPAAAGRFWNGSLDEVRVASVARSANWITTEYNNQSAPGTFETLGTEVSISGVNSLWFMMFPGG